MPAGNTKNIQRDTAAMDLVIFLPLLIILASLGLMRVEAWRESRAGR